MKKKKHATKKYEVFFFFSFGYQIDGLCFDLTMQVRYLKAVAVIEGT